MKYNKLVRDRIPEIIKNSGIRAITHIASQKEYEKKLKEKLSEEVNEYLEDSDVEELADILEVIYALSSVQGIDLKKLENTRKEKADKRGGFVNRIILEETDD